MLEGVEAVVEKGVVDFIDEAEVDEPESVKVDSFDGVLKVDVPDGAEFDEEEGIELDQLECNSVDLLDSELEAGEVDVARLVEVCSVEAIFEL